MNLLTNLHLETTYDGTITAIPDFDYENALQRSFVVIIKTTNGSGLSIDENFTIQILDVNEAPTDIIIESSDHTVTWKPR